MGAKQNKSPRLMHSPVSNRHRHLASRRSLDHQVRQAVSIVAAVAALLIAVLSSPPPELQTEDAPELQAKS
jgi:hypothetical protein